MGGTRAHHTEYKSEREKYHILTHICDVLKCINQAAEQCVSHDPILVQTPKSPTTGSVPACLRMCTGRQREDSDTGCYYCLFCREEKERGAHCLFCFICLCIVSLVALKVWNVYNFWKRWIQFLLRKKKTFMGLRGLLSPPLHPRLLFSPVFHVYS